MAETNKDKWMAGIKANNPDKNYENGNEDELYADAMAGYDAKREKLKKFEEDNAKAVEVLSRNPEAQSFLAVVLNGGSLGEAMAYLPNGDMSEEDKAAYSKRREEMMNERKAADEKFKRQVDNYTKSADALKAWADENGRTVEQTGEAIQYFVDKVLRPLDSGELTPEFFEMVFRIHNYDNDMAASKQAGIMEGRATAAGERATRRKEGDGLPALSPGGAEREKPLDKRSDLIGVLSRNVNKNNLFR